ncbi:hypothetical protein Q9247_15955 [Halomonas meridiana]|uniref:hypothetical protein n=1 Tax=Vreelandella aquamarina TaxID=77097 RepID=UPI00273BF85E|nr:hypothetical protein [Halomonas meridiana]MDP4559167.1 hypothetical protein [Halomonas meridiana]
MTTLAKQKLTHLCHRAFLLTAWGDDDPERRSEIEQIRHTLEASGWLAEFESAQHHGRHAHQLAIELNDKLSTQGDDETLGHWLESLRQTSSPDAVKHVHHVLKKWRKTQQSKSRRSPTQNTSRADTYRSSLLPATLREDGEHPNSLKALSPSARWEVLIDETGKAFDSTAEQAKARNPNLGRVVAIIKAEEATLPPLPSHFHGKDEPPEAVDQALANLLNAPQVGIFGFTVRDALAFGSYWMNHITQLVRWVLYMLPIEARKPTRVVVSIEQRSSYSPGDQRLQALSQTLEGEFKALDASRYAGLSLQLNIVPKEHPYLAYADAVAYTWGSSTAVSDDRLKKSRLLGPCLLNPHASRALPHLYQALSYHEWLPGEQWFSLCAAAEQDGPYGLLRRWLARLGALLKQERDEWARLLEEVQRRQRQKDVTPDELKTALDWLKRYMPDEEQLSGELILTFLSARLATANHTGQADISSLETLLKVSVPLEDENAPAVCHALLRAAITSTNRFEFNALESVLRSWVSKPMAIPGRLNHVKLHSTLGQLAAFQQQPQAAEAHFNQALEALAPLSDRRQAHKEALQIYIYRLMARFDGNTQSINTLLEELETRLTEATGRRDLSGVARRFAVGGNGAEVYQHHLLLRCCIAYPNLLRSVIDAYLSQSHAWQSHLSHPWGLIEAYRGWLLARQPNPEPARAERHFQAALALCFETTNGITLHWMGAVLHALALSLLPGFKATRPAFTQPEVLQRTLPQAPHDTLARLATLPTKAPHDTRRALIAECLPFNFH